jgi:glycosyltransferase involved in cell wall biosynthesis
LIILTNEKKSGIAFSRNRGIRIAQGEYIAFMDADDISQPERFEKQLAAFQKDPNLDICFTMMECFISPELPDDVKALRHCPIGPQSGAISPTVMIRKNLHLLL